MAYCSICGEDLTRKTVLQILLHLSNEEHIKKLKEKYLCLQDLPET